MIVDLAERVNGNRVQLPPSVAERLAAFNRQIGALIEARQNYLAGVLDTLGVDLVANDVNVDLDTFSYTLRPRAEQDHGDA